VLSRRLKIDCFILEGLNSFATVFYFYYLYFFMQHEYGFGNRANLELAAANGLIYSFAVWQGGKFAQRSGYFSALKLGFFIMAGALAVGARLHTVLGQIAVMVATILGMCFTWPTLEALVSEGETPADLPHMLGIYNVVWAGAAGVAYFTGGAVLATLGLKSMFYVPMSLILVQLALTFWLQTRFSRQWPGVKLPLSPTPETQNSSRSEREKTQDSRPKTFLRLAWLANPFAYVALNTIIAVMPGLARRLELSTMLAGFCGSVWCFARLAAFAGLWLWTGWHYRFRWLLAAYLTLIGAFSAILMAPNLLVLIGAQIILGCALGLIYYSSLFYSMDLGETKGEHGGIHEAVIGLGNFAGPALGAASLRFMPTHPDTGALAVSALLLAGLCPLLVVWRKGVRDA
jgi:predicted MFS family arabinose efflux permease